VPADAAEREIESAGFGVADAVPAFADFLGFEFQTSGVTVPQRTKTLPCFTLWGSKRVILVLRFK
jgi:hypothetical protein